MNRLAYLLGLTALAAPLHGQGPPIGGCLDRSLRPVPVLLSTSLPVAAAAAVDDGRPVMFWNPHAQFPTYAARAFIYLHECAHITLRHIWRANPTIEQRAEQEVAADCWAFSMMVEGGMLHHSEWRRLFTQLSEAAPDATHLSGNDRIASLQSCLAERTDPSGWRAALDTLVDAARQQFTPIRGERMLETAGPPLFESTVHPPATYECEIRTGPTLVCQLFAAQKPGPVRDRYHEISGIVRGWMPGQWVVHEYTPDGLPRLDAEDGRTGVQLSLVTSRDHRLYLVITGATGETVSQAGR